MRRMRLILTGLWLTVLVLGRPVPAQAVIVTLQGAGTVPTTPLPPNPNFPDLDVSEFNLNTFYMTTFGTASPNGLPKGIFGESPERFAFALESSKGVDVFQELSFTIQGNYWTIESTLIYNPATAVIFDPNDELTFKGTIQHTGLLSADGVPHPGDDKAGPLTSYEIILNAGQKKPHPTLGLPFLGVGAPFGGGGVHPSAGHVDIDQGAGFASVFSGSAAGIDFFDEIGSWTTVLGGQHVAVPEPASLLLLGGGLIAAGLRRRKKMERCFNERR